LRQGLDTSGAAGSGTKTDRDAAPATIGSEFHRQIAYRLYQELIAPLEPLFSNSKVLFIATSGALQSLPLSVLVTAQPQGGDANDVDLAGTHWLIDKYALVTLPAVSSLQTLRCFSTAPGERHPGCPPSQDETRQPSTPRSLEFVGIGAPVLTGEEDTVVRGAEDYSHYFHGDLADVESLRRLPALPGTESELRSIGSMFPNGQAFLLLGRDATVTNVKADSRVGDARILDFATHALVAEDTVGPGEPGLVLTPPRVASAEDDGLLTASDIAQLRLSAEFVVLSACNTAQRDGKLGAEGLAGLARAFFYAGVRALLVSHWSISDQATPELMKGVFSAMNENPRAGRAVALQQAIEHMKSGTRFIEPRYWAPFVVVGDTDERP
jgi:CHAT domain-containing protein